MDGQTDTTGKQCLPTLLGGDINTSQIEVFYSNADKVGLIESQWDNPKAMKAITLDFGTYHIWVVIP